MNGYPGKMIKNLIDKFHRKQQQSISTTNNTIEKPSKFYKGLTYSPHISENLRKLFIKNDNNLEIGFKPDSTINRIIKSPYPPLPMFERHGIIYSFGCNDCDGIYIGQTGQQLKNRIRQHKTDQNSKTEKNNNTAAFHHSKNTGHTFNFENTKILTTEKILHKRLTLETIHINIHRKNAVNLKSDIDNLNPAYTQLIKNLY